MKGVLNMRDGIKLIKGDCLEIMKDIPDKSVDLILCDLPYGTTKCNWDTLIPFNPLWEQYNRIIKDNGAVALFGSEPFSSALRMSNIKNYRYDWIWKKERGTGHLLAKKKPLNDYENIMLFYKKQPTYNPQMRVGKPYKCKQGYTGQTYTKLDGNDNQRFGPDDREKEIVTDNVGLRYPLRVIEFNKDRDKLHENQKPVALLEYIIKTYTNEGETALDNTMGSGSTGIACLKTNRNFIGIEQDDKYFEIAYNRINGYIYE